jgi:hypothetical protein
MSIDNITTIAVMSLFEIAFELVLGFIDIIHAAFFSVAARFFDLGTS